MSLATATTPDFLDRFESHLHKTLCDPRHDARKPHVLLDASRHLAFASAAKRMRPLLVDHFGAAVDLRASHRLSIATAAELIHSASLLHDDVIDEGTERRDQPTANAQWTNSVAVLGGDLLLCIALEQLYELPRSVTKTAVDLVAQMTRSAMREVHARRQRQWDIDDWEAIATGKTGALLGWCGSSPAIAVNRPSLAQRLADCGHRLGLAFQITDDVLDLMGRETGKDRYADLRHANPSFPIALARSKSTAVRAHTNEIWATDGASDQALEQAAAAIVESGAISAAWKRIEKHLDIAMESLGTFADKPGGHHIARWADQLRSIARNTMEDS